jgi:hypothetical protein
LESVRMKESLSISCFQRGRCVVGFEGVCAGETNRLVTLCVSLLCAVVLSLDASSASGAEFCVSSML